MDVREKLFTLFQDCNNPSWKWFPNNAEMLKLIDYLIANGVTVQELEGCKHCKGEFIGENHIVTLENDCGIDSIVEDEFLYNFCNCGTKSVVKINFCPMCGRRLPQPPKGE